MIAELIDELVVVLDTCVLAPMPLADLLLRGAEAPALYRVAWSSAILDELRRTLGKFGLSEMQIGRRLRAMESAFPEANIAHPEGFLDKVPELPDPDDRHVLAAAIASEANVIVTLNLRHFPAERTGPIGVTVLSPDEFLLRLFHLTPDVLLEKLDAQANAIGLPRADITERLRDAVPGLLKAVNEWTRAR